MVVVRCGYLENFWRRAVVALMTAGDAESAAVLTPYNGQVRLIRSILKSKGGALYDKVR